MWFRQAVQRTDQTVKAAAKSAGACSSLKQKDLAQLVALYAANKPSADEVSTHLDACQGKGEDNQDCKAAQAAIAQLKCE